MFKKQNFKKFVSVFVCLAIMLTNFVSLLTTSVSAEVTESEIESVVETTQVIEPVEMLPYYMGDSATTFPGTNIDIRGIFNGVSGRVSGETLEDVAPKVSKVGEGYSGTAAMVYGTDKGSFYRYLTKYRLEGAMSSLTAEPITIEMKVKLVSGKVKALYAGQYRLNAPADVDGAAYTTENFYTTDDLSTTEWTTLKFTRTEEDGTSRWMFINLVASGSQGAVILIDDIKVYLESDPLKTNYFVAENIYLNTVTKDCNIGCSDVGTFDIVSEKQPVSQVGYYLGENTVEPGASFAARNAENKNYSVAVRTEIAPKISEAGEGYNGSYAIKVGHTAPLSRYRFLFRFSDAERGAFVSGESYTIEMKVKKLSGTLDTLAAGQYLNAPSDYLSEGYYTDTDISTEEYTTLTFTRKAFNPNKTETDDGYYTGVRYVYFDITALGDAGVELLIDDIYIYATDDETKTNIFTSEKIQVSTAAGFEEYIGGAVNVGEFDTFVSYNKTNDVAEEGVIYSYPYRVADSETLGLVGNKIKGANASVITNGNAPKFTELGAGVKGSYAMEIGGTSAIGEDEYVISFAATGLPAGTKLRIEANVKLVSGSVYTLDMGILPSQTVEKTLAPIPASLLSDEWSTFSWTQTTVSDLSGWSYFKIELETPDAAIVHIDNIKIYADGDATKTQVFSRFTDFNLNFDIPSFTPVLKDSSNSIYTPSLNYSDLTIAEGTTATAELVCMENAHSGDYALAFGYDGEQKLADIVIRFGLREVLPGKRYRVSFATAISGGTFYKMSASLTSAIGNADDSEVLVYGHTTANPEESALQYIPYDWTEVSFDFYEGGTLYDRGYWSYLKFAFEDYNMGVGDSALFIDSVSINEIDEDGNIIGPNIFGDGGFEFIDDTFDWENYDSPFWSEGGADDFTFMNEIDKEIGAYNATVEAGTDLFNNMLTKEPYNNFDTYMIKGSKKDVMIYEAEKLKQYDKKVWLGLTDLIKTEDSEGNITYLENWQELILDSANTLQVICGDNFQGFYFDEPGYYITNEEYIEITQWLRETFKKRVWAIHYKGTINDNENSKLTITKESHQYTTDVGYWRYGNWGEDATETFNVFKGFCSGDDPTINLDTRKWIVPILGRHAYYYQTPQDVYGVIHNMYEEFSEISGFGGVSFYSMAYNKTTATVEVDENGGDDVLTAIANQVLNCVDTENVVENEDGTRTYTFLQYGGYYMLDKTDKDYLPTFDVVYDEVVAIIDDFAKHNALISGDNLAIDNNLIITTSAENVDGLIADFGIDGDVTVSRNGEALLGTDKFMNGDVVSVSTTRGENLTYNIIIRFDTNSDGVVNAIDVVRGKKAVLDIDVVSQYEIYALTASRNNPTITDVATIRNIFMG